MGLLAVFVRQLAMPLCFGSMSFGLVVFAKNVVVLSLMVVMRRCMVMPGGSVVMVGRWMIVILCHEDLPIVSRRFGSSRKQEGDSTTRRAFLQSAIRP